MSVTDSEASPFASEYERGNNEMEVVKNDNNYNQDDDNGSSIVLERISWRVSEVVQGNNVEPPNSSTALMQANQVIGNLSDGGQVENSNNYNQDDDNGSSIILEPISWRVSERIQGTWVNTDKTQEKRNNIQSTSVGNAGTQIEYGDGHRRIYQHDGSFVLVPMHQSSEEGEQGTVNEGNQQTSVAVSDLINEEGPIGDNNEQYDDNEAGTLISLFYHDPDGEKFDIITEIKELVESFNDVDSCICSVKSLSECNANSDENNGNIININKDDALVWACLLNKIDRVTSLLNEGADVNCTAEISGYRISPMHAACFQGHLDVVRILLQHNADINKLMNGRLSSIHLCCIHGKSEILEHILNSSKYQFSKEYIRPIFQLACSYGYYPIVEMLLSRNLVNVNERQGNGPSALYSTYMANEIDLAQLLLCHGATDDYVDSDGRTVLHYVCATHDLNFVKQMIDFKIVHERADSNGDTALHFLLETGSGNEQSKLDAAKGILTLLLSAGFNVNSRNKWGQTPFLKAARLNPELIPILLEYKCDVTIRDNFNSTALHHACDGPRKVVEVLKLLISECKLNVNDVDTYNSTPLHYINSYRDLKVIEFLIENGSQVNISDKRGQTALHKLVDHGNHDAIKVLLDTYKRHIEKNGNSSVPLEMASLIDAEDDEDISPLQMARIRGDKEAIKILIEYKGQESNTVNSSSFTWKSFPSDGYLLRMLGITLDEIISTIEKEELGKRRFMRAVYYGSIEEVRMMIDTTDLDSFKIRSVYLVIDGIMLTALDLACYYGNIHMVSMLYEYIPLTVHSDGVVISALLAYIGHHYDIVEYFLDHIQPGQNYSWLLIMACIDNQVTLVKSILDRNGDHAVISRLSQGELRLCEEYYERHLRKIDPSSFSEASSLFRHKINSDICSIVFSLACHRGRVEIVELLLPYWESQRHIDISDDYYGPIHLVCRGSVEDLRDNEYRYVKILRLLVSAGEDVNEIRLGRAPLHNVCLGGQEERLELLKVLLDSPEIFIEVRDAYHLTPLLIACKYGYSQTASMLLDYGADVNVMDKDGNNPLHKACRNENPALIQRLLEKKASLISQNNEGQTPLHVAAEYCWEREFFELLLQTKQNAEVRGSPDSSSATDSNSLSSLLDIRDKNEQTALSIALENDNEEAVEILQRVGALI